MKKRKRWVIFFSLVAFFNNGSTAFAENSSVKKEVSLSNSLMEEAGRYYDATLFNLAIPIYEELLKTLHVNTEQRALVRLRLGQSYYFTNQYSKIPNILEDVITTTQNSNPSIQTLDSEALFLLGLSFNKLNKFDQAAASFQTYLSSEGQSFRPFHFESVFELGVAYFNQKKYAEAKQHFSEITQQTFKKKLYPLSQFYLARIAVAEQNYTKAEKMISTLSKEANVDEAFPFALAFLQGEIYFAQREWSKAIHFFQWATPLKNIQTADWAEDSLFYLGWSFLNLSEEQGLEVAKLKNYLSDCEQTFKKLIEISGSDRAYLGLGQCYLSQSLLLGDKNAIVELEVLLSDKRKFSSREALLHALLLRAEASPSYSERKKFFRQLTDDSNRDGPYYSNSWYLRGLNEFEEGQRQSIAGNKNEAKIHLEHAIADFNKTFDLFFPLDKKMAVLALKFQVYSYYYLKTREGNLKGLAILGKILNQYRDTLFIEIDDQGEIFFLQGLIAANLTEGEEGKTFFSIAESSLVHNIESYPRGEYYDESLRLLGTLYYSVKDYSKSQEAFLALAQKTPPSNFTGEALFWASNCSEMLGVDSAKTKQFRRKIFEQYPDSPFAAEALFRYYDFAEYVKGNPQAIENLVLLMHHFPNSPYTLNAFFLKGLNELQEKKSSDGKLHIEKSPSAAIETFGLLEDTFNDLYTHGYIPEEKLEYFLAIRYRGLLERSLIELYLAEEAKGKNNIHLQNAERLLHQMYADFEDPEYKFFAILTASEPLSSLNEECSYHLARCYVLEGDDDAAGRLLQGRIRRYEDAKITRGYYLSKIWYELGKLALRQKQYPLAIERLRNAEDAAKGKVLRADELLDLWIEQSHCFRCKGDMDEAMLILSRVINYDAVSPKRLEAMFLRAEIYEEQGRQELAKKQLEAIAAKGGKWAVKAKEKLEKNYVYQ
jgi:tetratricopeptide (TPR) repeat protein